MGTLLLILGSFVAGYVAARFFTSPRVRYVRVQPPPVDGTSPPPGESARSAAEFVREVAGLAERLAARNISVHELVCWPRVYWALEVARGTDADRESRALRVGGEAHHEVTRVAWDGRENDVSVEVSPKLPNLKPNQWKQESRTRLGENGDATGFAEELLIQRFR